MRSAEAHHELCSGRACGIALRVPLEASHLDTEKQSVVLLSSTIADGPRRGFDNTQYSRVARQAQSLTYNERHLIRYTGTTEMFEMAKFRK